MIVMGDMSISKRHLSALAVMILLGVVVYSNTFGVPFIFDDVQIIVQNEKIRDISNVPSYFVDIDGVAASRPLMHALNALNYHFGGLDTRGYHIVNLLIHLSNGTLLYFFILMAGKGIGLKEDEVWLTAAMASILFVVHPVQTEAVTNIQNRSMLLSTMFYLLGLILFHKGVNGRKPSYFIALFIASLLGMASRENFVMFPIVLVVYDLLFLSGMKFREVKSHYRAHLPVMASLAYFVYLALSNTYISEADVMLKGVPPMDYVLTEFNVHWTYLRLLFLPMGQTLDYDYPISKSLFAFPTLLAFIGYVGLWIAGAAAARRKPVLSLCLLWFVIAAAPICFGVALMKLRLDDVLFEHRLYLPSIGPIVLASAGIVMLAGKMRSRGLRAVLLACLLIIPLVLSAAAYARNSVWRSKIIFWEDVVRKAPGKWRGHYNLGSEYKAAGLFDKALVQYNICIGLKPEYYEPYNNTGNIYLGMRLYEKAIEQYALALKLNPEYADAHFNMGISYYYLGRFDEAIGQYKSAIGISPDDPEYHYNLGVAYMDMGNAGLARGEFGETLRLDPSFQEARVLLEKLSTPSAAGPVEVR